MIAAGTLVGAAWMLYEEQHAAEPHAAEPKSPLPSKPRVPAAAPEAAPSPAHDRWEGLRAKIVAARTKRGAPEPDEEPDRCAEGCQGTLQLQMRLASAVEGCRELLPADALGTNRYVAHVLGEPGVGAIVGAVEITDDGIESPAFDECMIESARLVELGNPDEPVSDAFAFRFTAGPPPDNAADFLRDHPEVIDAHPELGVVIQRAPNAPRSDEDATLFATAIASDQSALSAFMAWTADQGIDLSTVHIAD